MTATASPITTPQVATPQLPVQQPQLSAGAAPPAGAGGFAQHLERAARRSPAAEADIRQTRSEAARNGDGSTHSPAPSRDTDADAHADAGNASAAAGDGSTAARGAARNQRNGGDRPRTPAGDRRSADAGGSVAEPAQPKAPPAPQQRGDTGAAADPAALLASLMALAHGQRPLPAPPTTTAAATNAARAGGSAEAGVGSTAASVRDTATAVATAGSGAPAGSGATQTASARTLSAAADGDGPPALQAAADAAPTLPAAHIDAAAGAASAALQQLRGADSPQRPDGGGSASAAPLRAAQIAAPFGTPEFAPGLGAEISMLLKDGVREAQLQLNPAEMGPISVRIDIDGSNAQVQMAAERADTRAALEQAMPELAGAMRDNGLTLTGGGVFEQAGPPPDRGGAADGGNGRGHGAGDGSADNGSTSPTGGDGREPQRSARAGIRLVRSGGVDLYA